MSRSFLPGESTPANVSCLHSRRGRIGHGFTAIRKPAHGQCLIFRSRHRQPSSRGHGARCRGRLKVGFGREKMCEPPRGRAWGRARWRRTDGDLVMNTLSRRAFLASAAAGGMVRAADAPRRKVKYIDIHTHLGTFYWGKELTVD